MTVIAWHKEKGIALDSQCTRGRFTIPTAKYCQFEDWLLVGTGDAGIVQKVFDAITRRIPISFEMKNTSVYAFHFATKDRPFEVFTVGAGLFPDYRDCPPHLLYDAIGIGSIYAVAAMNMGLSPVEAVKTACKFSTGCGGEIVTWDINGVQP